MLSGAKHLSCDERFFVAEFILSNAEGLLRMTRIKSQVTDHQNAAGIGI
jgi:hypothetical protein